PFVRRSDGPLVRAGASPLGPSGASPVVSSDPSSPVRIVVAEPGDEPRRLATVDALRRLGGGVRIEGVHDARACLEPAGGGAVGGGGGGWGVGAGGRGGGGRELRGARRGGGPPAVVVTGEATADAALDTFRAGAADCVTASADYGEVLPAVALEQIRAFRAAS